MAIQMNLAYSKKLGLPQYSSHSFSVSLVTEVTGPDNIPGEVDRVYRILQQAVDAQIVNPGIVPGNGDDFKSPPTTGNGHRWNCSEKQGALIERLVNESGLDWDALNTLAQKRFGVRNVWEINKLGASALIDELFDRIGGRRNGGGKDDQARAGRSG